jgi:hypothetical protein
MLEDVGSATPGTPQRDFSAQPQGTERYRRHRGTQYRSAGHPGQNKHCATLKRPMPWLSNISIDEIFALLGCYAA